MPVPAAVLMSVGAIGFGVLAFAFFVGFSRPQAMTNSPHRRRRGDYTDNVQTRNESVRQREIVCNDCSICQDEIESYQEVTRVSCGHRFHTYCIKEWLRNSKTCPSCRSVVITD